MKFLAIDSHLGIIRKSLDRRDHRLLLHFLKGFLRGIDGIFQFVKAEQTLFKVLRRQTFQRETEIAITYDLVDVWIVGGGRIDVLADDQFQRLFHILEHPLVHNLGFVIRHRYDLIENERLHIEKHGIAKVTR